MWKFSQLAAGMLATACIAIPAAKAQDAETGADTPLQEPPRCVRLVNINGYSVIDSKHLLINGAVSRRYLATLRSRCPEMRFGYELGTTFGRNARVCQPALEFVVFRNGIRCAIETIEEVDSLEAARALIEAREDQAQASADSSL